MRVEDLRVTYGGTVAVDSLSFAAEEGEFVTLVGPSGCGKTTTLMSIAGLVQPSAGRILAGDAALVDVGRKIDLPPEDRNCGVVFQSYAIWPHLSVFGNVAFPLKLRRQSKDEISRRVMDSLELVDMEPYADRFPHQLSGGQQQRVALARALAYSPGVLLLDEPLSNLDAKLRRSARVWLKRLQRQIGLTTIYVTHDQDEALTLSDRVLVLNSGLLEQAGTPEEIYNAPQTPFVADFIGSSNVLRAKQTRDPGTVRLPHGDVLWLTDAELDDSEDVTISVRPEALHLVPASSEEAEGPNVYAADIVSRGFLGSRFEYQVRWGAEEVMVVSKDRIEEGPVRLHIPPSSCRVLAPDRTSAAATEMAAT